jgi:arylsulfatase A-like enzyme
MQLLRSWEKWLALGLVTASVEAHAARPNFLILLADDMRADAIHAHGNPHVATPALDRLVRDGFSFREAHCFGSNSGAVCVPSRAMLMTGRPWMDVRNDLEGVETLPAQLARAGYETFLAGKWHNGAKSCEAGFQRGDAVFLGGMTDQFHPLLRRLANGRLDPPERSAKFSTDAIADAAVRFLDARPRSKSFFAWVSFTVPHDPRTPKPEYAGGHDPARLPLPENFIEQHPFDNGWLTVRDEELLGWPREPADIRRELAAYHALITHLDERIGNVIEALERSSAASDTVVVFLADHGLALGSHGLLGKQSLYEHSMRAPFVVSGPGIPAGRESRELIYLHDLHPTVIELAGLPAAAAQPRRPGDGRSLVPLWKGEAAGWRDQLFTAFTDTMRAVRDARWKLIVYPKINHAQLFDLETDPHETRNLVETDPQRAAMMTAALQRLQEAIGDRQPLSTDKPQPKEIDLRGRRLNPRAAEPPKNQ